MCRFYPLVASRRCGGDGTRRRRGPEGDEKERREERKQNEKKRERPLLHSHSSIESSLPPKRRPGTSLLFLPSHSPSPPPLQKRPCFLPMPSRALALPSAAALLATFKGMAATVAPSLYAAVGAAVAFLLGLRLVFGTLASCLPFGCKVRSRKKRGRIERTRASERQKREAWNVSTNDSRWPAATKKVDAILFNWR